MKTKFIFVTGGVLSSLGKGICAASLGRLLKSRGYSVTIQKFDPYINIDPGTMNPIQHGEVFVTDDGGETDLDLGHYERFIDENLSKYNNFTSGKIYKNVIDDERKGKFLGATVQVIPHITDEIKSCIKKTLLRKKTDIVITEIGGTVGDIESLPFLEAIRQFKKDVGKENVLYIHVTYVPYLKTTEELKSKPTQHSVKELRSIGIQPDIIICRSETRISDSIRKKISLFCDIEVEDTIEAIDVKYIYEVPLMLQKEKLDLRVLSKLGLSAGEADLKSWEKIVDTIHNLDGSVKIGIVGKYTNLKDSYISIVEALNHGGYYFKKNVDIVWINSELLEKNCQEENILESVDGILVPYGFGSRGINGKINAIKCAREKKIPFFGICLGMHCAVIEFARNVMGLKDANSTEFDPDTKNPVIDIMHEQRGVRDKGGTMRLGTYECKLKTDSNAYRAYKESIIYERHRHRYELNNSYIDRLEEAGLIVTGINPDKNLAEIVEIKDHPWFVGVQFHPEFKSRPERPHPLFRDFIEASIKYSNKVKK
ncbi:MAG: CTP synthase [Actinomycetota bacterium]|nr:CTP synthase [Actinomycetota bacterium]MDD5600968.1 CTP synthase [Actinomycetota bacterium]